MKHPPIVNRARTLRQTQSVAEKILWERLRRNQLNGWGYLVIRVKERVVRDGIEHVAAWIGAIGGLVLADEVVPDALRRLDTVPLP